MEFCDSRFPAVLILFLFLFGAGGAQAATLQGSEWKPLRLDELEVPADSAAFVQFRSKGRLVGFSGCNRFFADYETQDGYLFIGPVAATRMTCADSVMQREAVLAQALENARSYRRVATELVLFDSAGQPILEMRQTDWD